MSEEKTLTEGKETEVLQVFSNHDMPCIAHQKFHSLNYRHIIITRNHNLLNTYALDRSRK